MDTNDYEGGGLAPLQLDGTPSCYQLGPGSSERMAVMAPGHALQAIDRIEINRFVERQGVTYYVLEVYLKHQRSTKLARPRAPRVVGFPTDADGGCDEVLIDVELNATPSLELERRYSEFEALRHKLSVCFENLHPGDCTYCDTFIDFLSCSSVQPGLLTKLTTRAPQRKAILCGFINRTIELALRRNEATRDGAPPVHCDGWSIIPQIVESFLREQRTDPGMS